MFQLLVCLLGVSFCIAWEECPTVLELTDIESRSQWNLQGEAVYVGPEVQLTTISPDRQQGFVVSNDAIDLSQCERATVDFKYRIWDGEPLGADGLTFWILPHGTSPTLDPEDPPGTLAGGCLGVPMLEGLKVSVDTYNPPDDLPEFPALGIWTDTTNQQCLNMAGPGPGPPYLAQSPQNTLLRGDAFQHMSISIVPIGDDYVTVTATVPGRETISVDVLLPMNAGYVGISGATGGRQDTHSIRDLTVGCCPAPGPQLCYHQDTLIEVPGGEVRAAKDIHEGDWLNGEDGQPVQVVHQIMSGTAKHFVKVEQGAFSPTSPSRDVLVTHGHVIRGLDGDDVVVRDLVGRNPAFKEVSFEDEQPLINFVGVNRTYYDVAGLTTVTWSQADFMHEHGLGKYELR